MLLGRIAMTNLESIFKSRDIAKKGPYSQSYGFSSSHVWMWELDYKWSWAPKNWCFWTVVLEKTLESSVDCKKIQPVILKEISPEYSLEGLMWSLNSNSLATWCEEMTHWERPWCWERLKEGGKGDDRRWDGWITIIDWIMAWPNQQTWVWVSSGSWWLTGKPGVLPCSPWGHKWSDMTKQLNWAEEVDRKIFI